jgi:flagellar biosynthesis anti-sigma factor FlgM
MTVVALRSSTTCHQRWDALESTRSRFGRDRVSSHADSGKTKVDEIRARILSGTYTVDAVKIADAIVARLLAGQSVRETDGAGGK